MADSARPVQKAQKESGSLRFLYGNPLGRVLLRMLVRPGISRLGGAFMNSPFSRSMIKRFIAKNNIPMDRYEEGPFRCYNDFFCRRLAKPLPPDEDPAALISPCDAKLSVYEIDRERRFFIKGAGYRISELLQNEKLAEQYAGGLCLIFRLTVDDYHRYCYIDSGTKGPNIFIPGKLHTVQPIALRECDIYKENCREYTVMETENFGRAVQVEVGALMVGKIENFQGEGRFEKGGEKGMFQFGGSTIVLLLEAGRVHPDPELTGNTKKNLETIVKIGERIGTAI